MPNLTYSDIHNPGIDTPEVIQFQLHIERPTITVFVSREALEDLAAAEGVNIDKLAGGLVEFAEKMQPELARTAERKIRMLEAVQINAGDIAR